MEEKSNILDFFKGFYLTLNLCFQYFIFPIGCIIGIIGFFNEIPYLMNISLGIIIANSFISFQFIGAHITALFIAGIMAIAKNPFKESFIIVSSIIGILETIFVLIMVFVQLKKDLAFKKDFEIFQKNLGTLNGEYGIKKTGTRTSMKDLHGENFKYPEKEKKNEEK